MERTNCLLCGSAFIPDVVLPASANSQANLYHHLYVLFTNNVSSHLTNYNFLLNIYLNHYFAP